MSLPPHLPPNQLLGIVVPTMVTGSGTGAKDYLQPQPVYEQLSLFPEPEPEEEEDDLEVVEEVTIEKEYDTSGNVVKETRRVRRPVQRRLKPRTPPVSPEPRPVPWTHPQPWIAPNPNQYPPYQYWIVGDPPYPPQIYCGDIRPNINQMTAHDHGHTINHYGVPFC